LRALPPASPGPARRSCLRPWELLRRRRSSFRKGSLVRTLRLLGMLAIIVQCPVEL
jgi:hypothetical protein